MSGLRTDMHLPFSKTATMLGGSAVLLMGVAAFFLALYLLTADLFPQSSNFVGLAILLILWAVVTVGFGATLLQAGMTFRTGANPRFHVAVVGWAAWTATTGLLLLIGPAVTGSEVSGRGIVVGIMLLGAAALAVAAKASWSNAAARRNVGILGIGAAGLFTLALLVMGSKTNANAGGGQDYSLFLGDGSLIFAVATLGVGLAALLVTYPGIRNASAAAVFVLAGAGTLAGVGLVVNGAGTFDNIDGLGDVFDLHAMLGFVALTGFLASLASLLGGIAGIVASGMVFLSRLPEVMNEPSAGGA